MTNEEDEPHKPDEDYLTPFGTFTLYVDHEEASGCLVAWIGADCFEYHNEDYPEFNLLDVVLKAIHDNTTGSGHIDEPFRTAIRSLATTILEATDIEPTE